MWLCRINTLFKNIEHQPAPARHLITAAFFAFCCLFVFATPANAVPAPNDITDLAGITRLIHRGFMQASFVLRMRYELNEQFTDPKDAENLKQLANKAKSGLEAVEKRQRTLIKQIEDYQSDDWDQKYGSTGLWRKLTTDLHITILSSCDVDLYLALVSKPPQRQKILLAALADTDSLKSISDTVYLQFLKARTLALLARTDPAYRPLAQKELDELTLRPDISNSFAFRAKIEKIKLSGSADPNQLKTFSEKILQSDCADDTELVLYLALLQKRLNQHEAFAQTVRTWPLTEDFIGSLIFSDLSRKIEQGRLDLSELNRLSVFEAELAAQFIRSSGPEDTKDLFGLLSETDKFQTPLILYTTAEAFSLSSPAEAVNLLIKASLLQQTVKDDRLNAEADKIAAQAAQLAYNLFTEDSLSCPPALEAFENYFILASDKPDARLEYLYSTVLNRCGRTKKNTLLLEKIAARPAGTWRNRARFDLILQTIKQKEHQDPNHRNILFRQLTDLIADCNSRDKNDSSPRTETISLYCRLLLESDDDFGAQKVLDILTEAEIANDPHLNIFRAKALHRSGRPDKSAAALVTVIDPNHCGYTDEIMVLLYEIIDEVELLRERTKEFPKMIQNCRQLALFCYNCLTDQQRLQAGLYLAELTALADNKDTEQLSAAEKLLNDIAQGPKNNENVDVLRCRARLFTAQNKFAEAAELWAGLCEIQKNQPTSQNRQSWKWWRAKFYQLNCWAKLPQTKKEDISHTIEVLQNSFADIPPPWAKKLNLLKQQPLN